MYRRISCIAIAECNRSRIGQQEVLDLGIDENSRSRIAKLKPGKVKKRYACGG